MTWQGYELRNLVYRRYINVLLSLRFSIFFDPQSVIEQLTNLHFKILALDPDGLLSLKRKLYTRNELEPLYYIQPTYNFVKIQFNIMFPSQRSNRLTY